MPARAVLPALALAAALLSGCGAPLRTGQALLESPPPPATPPDGRCGADLFLPVSMNQLVWNSVAGIVGTVREVQGPFWNSPDGGPTPAPWGTARYRWVRVVADEVLFDTPTPRTFGSRTWALAVKPGEELKVFAIGDGTPTGCLRSNGLPANLDSGVSQEVGAGTRVLWLLHYGFMTWHEATGDRDEWVLDVGAHGTWTLREGSAESLIPGRSAPADRLVARIRKERERGYHPEDRSGVRDPLEEAQPS